MGVNIHAFIEFDDDPSDGIPFAVVDQIRSFSQAELNIPRDLELFQALGHQHNDALPEPLFRPRGIPFNLSNPVVSRYYAIVGENKNSPFHLHMANISREEYLGLIQQNAVFERLPSPSRYGFSMGDGEAIISSPSWKSASWLFCDEVEQAVRHSGLEWDDMDPKDERYLFKSLVLLMRNLEKHYFKSHTRLVFWFEELK